MHSSVNWYFQTVDKQLGADVLSDYMQEIEYGNQDMSGGISNYWLESSLKISPIEQVELLVKLYTNDLGFEVGRFYGKTGTGRVDGHDISGWFVGFLEASHNTYFFATNIRADRDAAGSNASKITLSILSDLNIW